LNSQHRPPARLYRRDLQIRQQQPEWMDEPQLDAALHHQALAGLRRVHWWSGTEGALWGAMSGALHAAAAGGSGLKILDLASGGGDLALGIAARCQRQGLRAVVHGCDISATAVARAQRLAVERGLANVRFFQLDVITDAYPEAHYDVVMNSLFLHHLSAAQIIAVLSRMRAAADLVVADDLLRTVRGYWLAWIGCRILSRSPVVHFDGPVSVEAALTRDEILALAGRAGLAGVQFRRHWPERFLLTCRTRTTDAGGCQP
jgi:2-polyprenyl-3-methyl-5-hydroxy-6-metoxy-1,4-benzoquinol methylase